MKPSDRIKQLRDIRHEKWHGTDFTNRLCLGIMDYLDEQHERQENLNYLDATEDEIPAEYPWEFTVDTTEAEMPSELAEVYKKSQRIMQERMLRWRTLEEVLALFPRDEHKQEWEQTYSWEFIQERIKQLYNQQ